MGEIKSVKVDNWGVFFLQKLQNFFNKTDYCDLTLQFRDNSQLKVHRLVLSACTDYFNVLEQTCEVVDDAIIMPNGLQADVVVPIVNFMYTGTLEFELKMYNRLLRTAKDMNMTVLLKLLEAHRRTMEMHPQKTAAPSSPKQRRRATQSAANLPGNVSGRPLIQTNQGKRIVIGSNSNLPQHRSISSGNPVTRLPTGGPLPVRQIGSTTFTRIKLENEQQETNTQSGGYTLLKQSPQQQHHQQQSTPTSPFEQLRKGYNNNKRPTVTTFVSPPAKKPNLEDVKEFAEQQRMRKQIAAEYGDDDYDPSNIMDDDTIHNDDDDDEMVTASSQTQQTSATSASAAVQTLSSQQLQQQQSEDPPGTTTIIVKHEGPDKPPTIVVKDSSHSKMNHTKIISEVLRQYPHLVRSNKNIKLKIIPNAGGQAQKIIVKKEPLDAEKPSEQVLQPPTTTKLANSSKVGESQQPFKTLPTIIVSNKPKTVQQTEISESGKLNNVGNQVGANKSVTPQAAGSSNVGATTPVGQPQKRRIDSKTMHALIALGAENTAGPWLCLRCGRNGHPISIPSYRGFRRHLINTHKEVIDPALCEHCGWRSSSKRELHFHMQIEHKVKTNLYIFPECQLCQQMCIDSDGLNQHLIDSHPDENKQQCIYCNKIFPEEIQLYTHMKTFHKKQALEDGIIDYSDDENQQQQLPPLPPSDYDHEIEQEQQQQQKQQEKKIKILSDISLPIASSVIKTDSFVTETVQQQDSITSGVCEEYLHEQDHTETKFVAADGSEVILTPEQRKEILSQLNQEHDGSGVVMVLNENPQQYGCGETQSDQGAISQDETSQTTTVTNDEREEEVEEEEDGQHEDNQIYNEMKSLNSNIEEDSTNQAEVSSEAEAKIEGRSGVQEVEGDVDHEEHEERPEHQDESKESMDNLEWAENLISEHDLADEVSSQTDVEMTRSNKAGEKEEETKDADNKSQDEISKKLKELTGDWSEDEDEDMPEESLTEISNKKEAEKEQLETPTNVGMAEQDKKEMNRLTKEIDKEFDDHAELLASLQTSDKDETDKVKETGDVSHKDAENIDEDDIDIALKSLHKEDIEEKKVKKETKATHEQQILLKKDSEKEKEMKVTETKGNIDKLPTQEESIDKNVDVIKEESGTEIIKNVETKNPEGKLVKELETIGELDISSATEVDEETKRDLIDSLLIKQAEKTEDTAIEAPKTTGATINKNNGDEDGDDKTKIKLDIKDIKELGEREQALEDEFLDITTEKASKVTEEESPTTTDFISTTTNTVTTTHAASEVAEVSSSTKDATISSEERVKSLISEWGDDEDDDDTDANLTADL